VTLTTDLAYTSAAEMAARVKRRELSPVEIVDACIERIAARNPSLNAFAGLPVGMQIAGRRYADADVLAASAAFEQLRPWQATYRIPASRSI
jgi:Asp-tRNA(Asn)/Glu-tRNA(Gln) amidotransferase A subunit family amidase